MPCSGAFLLHSHAAMASYSLCSVGPSLDPSCWNKIIKRQCLQRNFDLAVRTFLMMRGSGVGADNFTFPVVLKAAAHLSSPLTGAALHGLVMKTGFWHHSFVQTALINMYAALGSVAFAYRVFERIIHRDSICWNSMLDAYASRLMMHEAVQLFDHMPVRDQTTFNTMLAGFADVGTTASAEKLFDEIPVRDVVSWNSMISAYVKAGMIESARSVFDQMPERNLVSWNSIIAGYLQCGRYSDAIHLFDEMKAADQNPNHVTLAVAISACAHIGSLQRGTRLHISALDLELASNLLVIAALIDMYAKCGSIEKALEVFYKSPKDIYCWNAMISGLAAHGYGRESLRLFTDMESRGLKPDDITFIGILTACSHGGLVEEGCSYFKQMEEEHGIAPKSEHYGCVVDLLARAGLLRDAYEVAEEMPFEPGMNVLGALLSACVVHGELEMGQIVAQRIQARGDELGDGEYVMMANFYAKCGEWDDAGRWRREMNEKGIRKVAGCSEIEVDGKIYRFLAGES